MYARKKIKMVEKFDNPQFVKLNGIVSPLLLQSPEKSYHQH